MALNANLSQVGRFKRVVTKAKTKPNAVPATPTEQPSKILLIAERLSYQLSKKGRRFSKVKLPSTQKVMANKRHSGYRTKTPNKSQSITTVSLIAVSLLADDADELMEKLISNEKRTPETGSSHGRPCLW